MPTQLEPIFEQSSDCGLRLRNGGHAGELQHELIRVPVDPVRATDRFADGFLSRAIATNALYEQKYPMVSGLARPLIAEEVVKVARDVGADAVAHGCTGKGNDQVRFETAFGVLAPDLEVLAPIRESVIPREKAIAYAEEMGIPIAKVATGRSP